MSKKKSLLNESSVRRFMKLAEIDSNLSDLFVSKNFMNEEEEMEMDAEMEMGDEPEMEMDDGVEAEITPEAAQAIVDLAAQLEDAVDDAEDAKMGEEPEMDAMQESDDLEEGYGKMKKKKMMEEDDDLGVDLVNEDEDLTEALVARVMNRLAEKRSLHEAKVKKAERIQEVADRVWDRIVKTSK